jgi:hypothetical protein
MNISTKYQENVGTPSEENIFGKTGAYPKKRCPKPA